MHKSPHGHPRNLFGPQSQIKETTTNKKIIIAPDIRRVTGKHQFVSLGVILYVISSIHEPKVRATMKHVKVDTGFVVKDVQEYLFKLFQVENVVYGFEPGKKKL